jgi:hypothetical protein
MDYKQVDHDFCVKTLPQESASAAGTPTHGIKKRDGTFPWKPNEVILCHACGQFHQIEGTHLYDYSQQVDEDLLCHICLQPLVDPLDTKCGHTFCSKCLKNYLHIQKMCPIDRQPLTLPDCMMASIMVRR